MRKLLIAAGLGAALLLGGCATTPHAVSSFRVQTVAPDSFILTARVYPRKSRDEVRREVLVRAARETLARGFDWFTLKRSGALADAAPEPAAEGAPAEALGLRFYGRRFGGMRMRRANNGPRPRDFQVQMFHGDKPAGVTGFVARDVVATMAPPPKPR
jgi:hypothetical protein